MPARATLQVVKQHPHPRATKLHAASAKKYAREKENVKKKRGERERETPSHRSTSVVMTECHCAKMMTKGVFPAPGQPSSKMPNLSKFGNRYRYGSNTVWGCLKTPLPFNRKLRALSFFPLVLFPCFGLMHCSCCYFDGISHVACNSYMKGNERKMEGTERAMKIIKRE